MLLESERDLVYDDPILAAGAPARSLASANDEYVIDGTLVRNIDKVTEASVSLRFDQTDSLSLLGPRNGNPDDPRSEEHTSELQSLMRISYAVFCLKKKK